MRIVFADLTLAYTVETPYHEPLGGSQSAVCYLAEALAAARHEVMLVTRSEERQFQRGVMCTGWDVETDASLRSFNADVVVAILSARYGEDLRAIFGPSPRLVLWTQHAHDQAAVQPLKENAQRKFYDGYALVSDWQLEQYVQTFGIERARARVLGNAVGPAFRNLFAASGSIEGAKPRPPVLAYTSTPFRGLQVLLDVFPEIRRRVSGTRLNVFSSMRVYQASEAEEREYAALYRACRETQGVEYVGSVPQPQLARELREITLLAYPNTFPETFCIAALEAMAAGCRVVTSELGALPQTTAGYARLVPIIGRKDTYAADFMDAVADTLEESLSGAGGDLLARQVRYVNSECTWERRAQEWIDWLQGSPPRA
jgi:glycosyltransferase involved in cell wall biosynthesis